MSAISMSRAVITKESFFFFFQTSNDRTKKSWYFSYGEREQKRENQILFIENFIDLFFFLSSCLSLSLNFALSELRTRETFNQQEWKNKNRHYNLRIFSIQEIRVTIATRNNAIMQKII